MSKERENTSKIKLSAKDGIPKVSFGAPAAGNSGLIPEEYLINGNDLVAYYDGAHKLVFVLDNTVIKDLKPNVLLIINPVADRKWDDILSNDYNVDLETVRPKKDNKYQKLDIEYTGLSIYNQLINDFNSDSDISDALVDLLDFRNAAARRAAADRLEMAEDTISKSRETITKTNETVKETQDKIKKLREKLGVQKKNIGKEPTKQSAAKILKTESALESTNDKLRRSKKRLSNAKKRMSAAEEDAAVARRILNSITDKKIKKTEFQEEPKAKVMAEDVKPLFDKDPEILDDKIAFKPIDFSVPSEISEPLVSKPVIEESPAPISFVPLPPLENSTELTPPPSDAPIVPLPELTTVPVVSEPVPEPVVVPMEPIVEQPEIVVESPAPAPVAAPVITERPASPITGAPAPVVLVNGGKSRPSFIYYLMLIILIALSIFTLWIYQKRSGDTVPDLTGHVKPEVTQTVEQPQPIVPEPVETTTDTPFIEAAPVVSPEHVVTEPVPAVVEEPVATVAEEVTLQEAVQDQADETYIPEPNYNEVPMEEPATYAPEESDVYKPEYDLSGYDTNGYNYSE